ncbi:MAG: hypothetical protein AB1916_16010 [Thermodesulfobacteriota bacterium]
MKIFYNTLVVIILFFAMLAKSYGNEPTLYWNNIMVTIPHGYYFQYFNKNTITVYPKDKNFKVHIAIEINDTSDKFSIMNNVGRKENNCTVTYIKDTTFDSLNAYKWKTDCLSLGARMCITIPEQHCEICLYGDEDHFDEVEQLLNNISFIKINK